MNWKILLLYFLLLSSPVYATGDESAAEHFIDIAEKTDWAFIQETSSQYAALSTCQYYIMFADQFEGKDFSKEEIARRREQLYRSIDKKGEQLFILISKYVHIYAGTRLPAESFEAFVTRTWTRAHIYGFEAANQSASQHDEKVMSKLCLTGRFAKMESSPQLMQEKKSEDENPYLRIAKEYPSMMGFLRSTKNKAQ